MTAINIYLENEAPHPKPIVKELLQLINRVQKISQYINYSLLPDINAVFYMKMMMSVNLTTASGKHTYVFTCRVELPVLYHA